MTDGDDMIIDDGDETNWSEIFDYKKIALSNNTQHLELIFKSGADSLEVDLKVTTEACLKNTNLVLAYVRMHALTQNLIRLVKAWKRAQKVNNSKEGFLCSYDWSLLVISYLQEQSMLSKPLDPENFSPELN